MSNPELRPPEDNPEEFILDSECALQLPHELESAGIVRKYIDVFLIRETDGVKGDVAYIVTELVANALEHTEPKKKDGLDDPDDTIDVKLKIQNQVGFRTLLISVHDNDGDKLPDVSDISPSMLDIPDGLEGKELDTIIAGLLESKRGLSTIKMLSESFKFELDPAGGKIAKVTFNL
ncbi:MAG TPA: hypothetical protein VNX65_01995 [Patescibacteria group bacterium]|nr:hypothetical protein [Patescibacteria group bacterium]